MSLPENELPPWCDDENVLKENCYEQYKRIEELEQTLLQEYERSRHYRTALSNISKMSMCMATSYMDLAQKQKDLAYEALEFKL